MVDAQIIYLHWQIVCFNDVCFIATVLAENNNEHFFRMGMEERNQGSEDHGDVFLGLDDNSFTVSLLEL